MAVNVKKQEKVQKYVEVAKHERLVANVFGTGFALYERGYAYPVNEEQLEAFLSFDMDGVCPFKLHKPAKKVEVVESVDGVSKVKGLPRAVAAEKSKAPEGVPSAQGKPIDIGDDSELDDIGAAQGEAVEEI